ncbi:MAG: hypothetical protein WD898_00140 [Candidatus Paceibacterota bacterium]
MKKEQPGRSLLAKIPRFIIIYLFAFSSSMVFAESAKTQCHPRISIEVKEDIFGLAPVEAKEMFEGLFCEIREEVLSQGPDDLNKKERRLVRNVLRSLDGRRGIKIVIDDDERIAYVRSVWWPLPLGPKIIYLNPFMFSNGGPIKLYEEKSEKERPDLGFNPQEQENFKHILLHELVHVSERFLIGQDSAVRIANYYFPPKMAGIVVH